MAQSRSRSRSWFPWKTLSFLLLLGFGVVVNNDVQRKGSFASSNVGIFLKDVGLYNRTVSAYGFTLECYELCAEWAEKHIPVHYIRARNALGPYVTKAGDQARWAATEIQKMGPVIVETVNGYVPGAKEKLFLFCSESGRTSLLVRDWLISRWRESIVLMQHATVSVKATVQDIFDGKIELKDVFNGIKNIGDQALKKADEVRRGLTT